MSGPVTAQSHPRDLRPGDLIDVGELLTVRSVEQTANVLTGQPMWLVRREPDAYLALSLYDTDTVKVVGHAD